MSGEDARTIRRRGKEARERAIAVLLMAITSPLFVVCAVAIKAEALVDPNARGPVFFTEMRVSRGRVFGLLKFRTLTTSALASLGEGPTHIALLEKQGQVTRAGRWIRQWYLDELPQLWNIVRGDMFLIGTRPFPVDLYEEELERGITRKRDMPAGLVGPVQAHKGSGLDDLKLDLDYWNAYQHASSVRMLAIDLRILLKSLRVQLQHKGI